MRSKLESHVWQQGDRLPSLSELAEQCKVSRTTMWKAICVLKKESLVHATQGGPIIAGPAGISSSAHAPVKGWKRIHRKLADDLFAGKFSPGVLPPVTKLAIEYRATPRTIHKALSALMDDRLVAREAHKYHITSGRNRSGQRTMVMIIPGTPQGLLSTEDPRNRAVADAYERECTRLGYTFRSICFFERSPQALLYLNAQLKAIRDPLGFIFSFWDPWDKTIRRRWQDAIAVVSSKKIPVIVLDQAGSFLLPKAGIDRAQVRLLRIAGRKAGAQVADYLVRHGHKQLAFITGTFEPDWVKDRYNGMVEFLNRNKGPEYHIELFSYSHISDQNVLVLAMLGLNQDMIEPLYRERLSADEIADLQKSASQIASGIVNPAMPSNDFTKTLQFLSHAMVQLADISHDAPAFASVLDRILHLASDGSGDLFLQPHFKKVLQNSAATAWVCADEKCALSAMSFLKQNGKKVPQDIAVIGFENWREAYESQLSTYDFNMPGHIQRALQLIVDERALKNCPVVSEVDGYVVERRTTRLR
jgi:DNA-binding LacI/PurR family transcriptional regulator/DNA-binding transcriptional regulator YhcF (GntR family)